MNLLNEINEIQSMLARSSMSEFEYDEIVKKLSVIKSKYHDDINRINPMEIISAVGVYFNLPKDYHTRKTRKREFVVARQIAIKIIYEKDKKLSLDQIGKYFNKDHATVLHSKKTVENLCLTDRHFRTNYDNILTIIGRSELK